MKLTLLPLITALVIAGCTTVPEIEASRLPEAPAAFKDADAKWTVAPPAAASPRHPRERTRYHRNRDRPHPSLQPDTSTPDTPDTAYRPTAP